jgi:hypothetical protein
MEIHANEIMATTRLQQQQQQGHYNDGIMTENGNSWQQPDCNSNRAIQIIG